MCSSDLQRYICFQVFIRIFYLVFYLLTICSDNRNREIFARNILKFPVADICDRLDLDLVGICNSTVSDMPKRYKNVSVIGTPMAPDMEKTASTQPDWILSPRSLQADLQPKYEAIHTQWAFLNLDSVQGMYKSIYELGIIFGKQKQADALVEKYVDSSLDRKSVV